MKITKSSERIPNSATYDTISSPVGHLTVITSSVGLHNILWESESQPRHIHRNKQEKTLLATKQQLKEYFAGKRKNFDLPLVLHGTDFQIDTWKQLLKIPYAETISYGEQAKRLGDKNKARAVGTANGFNPIAIVIPCHRVIASNGTLAGFRGGLQRKSFLLGLEQNEK
jgi:methylated-DNA-[protein]-cysteine S-methyltransferase